MAFVFIFSLSFRLMSGMAECLSLTSHTTVG